MEFKKNFQALYSLFMPYKAVVRFLVVMFAANFFWKLTVTGDESESMVEWLGMDISAPFNWMAYHMAHFSGEIINFLGWDVHVDEHNIIRHSNNAFSVQVIWACSGIKQAYICFCVLMFAYGPLLKKLWFVPLSLLGVYVFNLIRISFIPAYCETHPESFDFLHLYLFKYLFYLVIFLMWVVWEDKIAEPYRQQRMHLSNQ